MSKSSQKQALTKAGIVLSADARNKLQQLADWMERESKGQQDPRVKLSLMGGIVTVSTYVSKDKAKKVTFVAPFGALVQMFEPFKLVDANKIMYGVHSIDSDRIRARACSILEITSEEYTKLLNYVYNIGGPYTFDSFINAIRELR